MDMKKIWDRIEKESGKTMQQIFAEIRQKGERRNELQSQWEPKWELGDIFWVDNPLAKRVTVMHEDDDYELNHIALMLVHRHPDDPDMYLCAVAEGCPEEGFTSNLDTDIPDHDHLGFDQRVYSHLILWLHAEDMNLSKRYDKAPAWVDEVRGKVFDWVHGRVTLDLDCVKDDFVYEELVIDEYRRIIEAIADEVY